MILMGRRKRPDHVSKPRASGDDPYVTKGEKSFIL